jgi:ubiquinone biosynthesis protein COQ4
MTASLFAAPKSELDAVQVALGGSSLARMLMALRAGTRLALHTEDTKQVFYLAIAIDGEGLRRNAARLAADPCGRELMRERAAIDTQHVDYALLRALPADTLQDKNLDPDLFQAPPGMPKDLAYVAQRARQTHDLWHVITGFETDIPGEIALQAFSHEQTGLEFSRLLTRFGQMIFGLRFLHVFEMVKAARAAGAAAPYLLALRWEDHWAEPLRDLRVRLGLPAAGVWPTSNSCR